MVYFHLFVASLASAGATLLLRRAGLTPVQDLFLGLPQALLLKGLALAVYGLGFLAYAQALKSVPANLAYPVMTGVTLMLTLVAGLLWLGEGFSLRVAAGALLLLLGIVLIGAR